MLFEGKLKHFSDTPAQGIRFTAQDVQIAVFCQEKRQSLAHIAKNGPAGANFAIGTSFALSLR